MKRTAIIALLTLFLLSAAGYFFLRQKSETPQTPAVEGVITEEMQREMDLKALSSDTSTPHQRYGAMIRLAQKGELVARTEALKRSSDENALLRGGAAQALGYFDDQEAISALKKLLTDGDKSVRLFAIQGLGHRTETLREKELEALLQNPDMDVDQKVEIHSSLLKAASTDEKKNRAVAALLSIANDGDEPAQTEAAQRLVTLVPDDPRVVDLIKKKITDGKNERLIAVGTRYLSSRGEPWIKDRLKSLATHSSATVRSAVIQSLHRICPDDRWEILEGFLANEKDQGTLKLAIEEPMFLLGEPAVVFLKKAVAKKDLPPPLKGVAEETLEKIESSPGQETCGRR